MNEEEKELFDVYVQRSVRDQKPIKEIMIRDILMFLEMIGSTEK